MPLKELFEKLQDGSLRTYRPKLDSRFHRDFEVENIDLKEISKSMKNNETVYDMFADKRQKKFSENKRKLNLYPKNKLPLYIQNNENKFKEWLD